MTTEQIQPDTINTVSDSGKPLANRLLKRGLYATIALGLLAIGSIAHARIISGTDLVHLVNPDITQDSSEIDDHIQGRNEKQCKTLAAPLGPLPAGAVVSSHIFHLDPINDPTTATGKATFNGSILWVISDSATLDATDGIFGAPAVTYPAAGTEALRGLEGGTPDSYSVSSTNVTDDTITVTMEVQGYVDQVRVITCCGGPGVCD